MQVDPANFLDALKGEEHKEEHAAFAEVLARATALSGGVPVSLKPYALRYLPAYIVV